MGEKRHTPQEIVTKLRQVEVLVGQGQSRIDAIRQVQITEQTYYRWCKHYEGMGKGQLKKLKRLRSSSNNGKDTTTPSENTVLWATARQLRRPSSQ